MTEPGFCPRCEVTLDLHPDSDPEDFDHSDCDAAVRKADLLVLFAGMGRRR